jgi:hypothetical protein
LKQMVSGGLSNDARLTSHLTPTLYRVNPIVAGTIVAVRDIVQQSIWAFHY